MGNLFPKVVGHAAVKRSLAQAVAAGRLSGAALLLCGPDGTGRRTLARELARALNCKGDGEPLPCGRCGPCGRIERGAFGDVVEVAPDGQSIKIEQARELLEEMAMAPVEGRVRVFIVAPAALLTEDAQNALLKGLEEPPARSMIVLVAGREEELLPTVASRCRVVRLHELSPEETLEALTRAGLPRDEALTRARWSGGSPGRALSEEALTFARLADEATEAFASGAAWADPLGTADRLSPSIDAGSADAPTKRARLGALLRAVARALRD